jgi:hypothetical protein
MWHGSPSGEGVLVVVMVQRQVQGDGQVVAGETGVDAVDSLVHEPPGRSGSRVSRTSATGVRATLTDPDDLLLPGGQQRPFRPAPLLPDGVRDR